MTLDQLRSLIRDVPDFPVEGVTFKDITPVLGDAKAFAACIDQMAQRIAPYEPDAIVAIESRGFLFGAALAVKLGLPLQLTRKRGKLPFKPVGISYELEYGTDHIEMHADIVEDGAAYAVVDDVIATGGTAAATARLIEQLNARVACCAFFIELGFLPGRERLHGHAIESLIVF